MLSLLLTGTFFTVLEVVGLKKFPGASPGHPFVPYSLVSTLLTSSVLLRCFHSARGVGSVTETSIWKIRREQPIIQTTVQSMANGIQIS